MQGSDKFDAARYLTKLKGRDYLEVKWRMLWLRTEHPDAHVETELVEHDRQQRWAMFRATVRYPVRNAAGEIECWATATGYGQEDAAGFAGNPGDYPEKAETKALGRALSALGFGTQFTEDHDFAGDSDRVVDAPVDRPQPQGQGRARREQGRAQQQRAPQAAQQPANTVVTLNGGAHAPGRPAQTQPQPQQQNPGAARNGATPSVGNGAVLTGEKADGRNVIDVAGVQAVIINTPKGKRYESVRRCTAHNHAAWYAALNDEDQLTPWQHRTSSGGLCTMPRQ